MGSPHYMAPEQLRATCNADERTDLWALGAVLHELIAGQPPFAGQTVPEICVNVMTQPPASVSSVREDVPPEIERAVLRCLEKAPGKRFATVSELAHAIAPFGTAVARASCDRISRMAGGTPGPARETTPLPPLPSDDRLSRASWWPSGASNTNLHRRVISSPASIRVVLGAALMLAGIGAGVFMFMYDSVHGDDARIAGTIGVTAPQSSAMERAAPPAPPSAHGMAVPPAGAQSPALPLVPGSAQVPGLALVPAGAQAAPAVALAPGRAEGVAGPAPQTPLDRASPSVNHVVSGVSAPRAAPAEPSRAGAHVRPAAHGAYGTRVVNRASAPARTGAAHPHDILVAPADIPTIASPEAPPPGIAAPPESAPSPKAPPSGDDLFDGRK